MHPYANLFVFMMGREKTWLQAGFPLYVPGLENREPEKWHSHKSSQSSVQEQWINHCFVRSGGCHYWHQLCLLASVGAVQPYKR